MANSYDIASEHLHTLETPSTWKNLPTWRNDGKTPLFASIKAFFQANALDLSFDDSNDGYWIGKEIEAAKAILKTYIANKPEPEGGGGVTIGGTTINAGDNGTVTVNSNPYAPSVGNDNTELVNALMAQISGLSNALAAIQKPQVNNLSDAIWPFALLAAAVMVLFAFFKR